MGLFRVPRGPRPPERERIQQILITYNGPGTLLYHPPFIGQRIWARRDQVIGSESQGSEWSWDSN